MKNNNMNKLQQLHEERDKNGIDYSKDNIYDAIGRPDLKPREEVIHENDDPEISEKDFEDMYISLGKNETERMERRFNIWLEKRDDDFELDVWQFRCLQDFIQSERIKAWNSALEEQWKIMRENLKQGINKAINQIEEKSKNSEMLDSEAGFIAGLRHVAKETGIDLEDNNLKI